MTRTHDWRPDAGGGWIARVGTGEVHIVLRVRDSGKPSSRCWWWTASIADQDVARGASDSVDAAKAEALRGAAAWLRDSLAALEAP